LDASRSVTPRRRAVLGGSAAVLATAALAGSAAGCTSVGQAAAPVAGPEVRLLDGVIQSETGLIALYDAVLAAHQGLAGRLKTPRDHHVQHLAVLRRHYVPGSTGDSRGTATPTPRPTPSAPATETAALSAIRGAERKAASARADEVRRASPGLSQLLAAIGACEAGHAQELA
jgi:hypothetical protein